MYCICICIVYDGKEIRGYLLVKEIERRSMASSG